MQAFLDANRSPTNSSSDPRAKQRKVLQTAANSKIATRQRPVLPEGVGCALWSFQVPWAPFEYYLSNPCNETKPFLWSNSFHVGNTEWMIFFGIEPMEAEGGRCSLWMGVCNNLATPVVAFTKLELWKPGGSDCGTTFQVGSAVDHFNPCGQVYQKNKFGRFWWHLSPSDFQPQLFRGTNDAPNEQSFEVFLTVKLSPSDTTERNPAAEEDPHLWEISCRYLQPWVQARVAGVVAPLEQQIARLQQEKQQQEVTMQQEIQKAKDACAAQLQQKEREIQELSAKHEREMKELAARNEELSKRNTHLENKLREAAQIEDALRKAKAKLEAQVREAAEREQKLKNQIAQQEEKLRQAAALEKQLREWGHALEKQVKEGKAREEALQQHNARLEDYIKNIAVREERMQTEIRQLEGQVKQKAVAEQMLAGNVARLQHNVKDMSEREDLLRESNRRLYQATACEKALPGAVSTSPHNPSSPQRMRALANSPSYVSSATH